MIDLSAIKNRDKEAFGGGFFLAGYETCDEDGSMCPDGKIYWVPDEPTNQSEAEEYDGVSEVCDVGTEEAVIFVAAIDDRRALLEYIEQLEARL